MLTPKESYTLIGSMGLPHLSRSPSTSPLRLSPLDAAHDEEDAHDRGDEDEARDDVVQDVVAACEDAGGAVVLARREGCDRVVGAVVDGGEMHLGLTVGVVVCGCALPERWFVSR